MQRNYCRLTSQPDIKKPFDQISLLEGPLLASTLRKPCLAVSLEVWSLTIGQVLSLTNLSLFTFVIIVRNLGLAKDIQITISNMDDDDS